MSRQGRLVDRPSCASTAGNSGNLALMGVVTPPLDSLGDLLFRYLSKLCQGSRFQPPKGWTNVGMTDILRPNSDTATVDI
jgi:hypothetical protein